MRLSGKSVRVKSPANGLRALGALGLAAVFQETRYRWAALAVFAAVLIQGVLFVQRETSLVFTALVFTGAGLLLLLASWWFARRRGARAGHGRRTPARDARHPDPQQVGGRTASSADG